MRHWNAILPILLLLGFVGCGVSPKTPYSSLPLAQQEKVQSVLSDFTQLYYDYTVTNERAPSGWSDMEKHLQEVEADINLDLLKDVGYSVKWRIPINDVQAAARGAEQANIVLATAPAGAPSLLLDGTIDE